MYITEKEKDNLLAAIDFISTNADCAEDYEPFKEMKSLLQSLFDKAVKDIANRKATKHK